MITTAGERNEVYCETLCVCLCSTLLRYVAVSKPFGCQLHSLWPKLSVPDFVSDFSPKLWDKIQNREPGFEATNFIWLSMNTILNKHRRHSLDMGSVSLLVLSKGLALILQLLVTNLKVFPANSFSSSPDKHYSQSIHRGIHYWVPILKIICRSRDTLHNISSFTWYSYSKYSVSVSNIRNTVVYNSVFNQYCHY